MDQSNGEVAALHGAQLQAVQSLIQRRLSERISVAELADAAGLSESCFARLFKQTTGKTPHAFILEQRVARAAEIIAKKQASSLTQIALQCGFADQAHLTRIFRRFMGRTPAQFCRSVRQGPRPPDRSSFVQDAP